MTRTTRNINDALAYGAMMPHMDRYMAMLSESITGTNTGTSATSSTYREPTRYVATPSQKEQQYAQATTMDDAKKLFMLGVGYGLGLQHGAQQDRNNAVSSIGYGAGNAATCTCGHCPVHASKGAGDIGGLEKSLGENQYFLPSTYDAKISYQNEHASYDEEPRYARKNKYDV